MREFRYIQLKHIEESILLVTLSRPEKRNALNLLLLEELMRVFENLQGQSIRVVMISAEGDAFCSGMDLQEVADLELYEELAKNYAKLLKIISTAPLITIALVQGDALAGGAGLLAVCDFSLLVKSSRIGFPEVRRGLVAAQVASVLCRKIRMQDLLELLLIAEPIESERALSIGLVNRIVEKDKLLLEGLQMAKKVMLGEPQAILATKSLVKNLVSSHFSGDLDYALSVYLTQRKRDAAAEGINAFLGKRKAKWIVE